MSGPVPQHIAIVMDGNRRWARQRHLPAIAGHRAGVETIRKTLRAARERGVEYLTLYSFSTENWSRDPEEVRGLMGLLEETIRRETEALVKDGAKPEAVDEAAIASRLYAPHHPAPDLLIRTGGELRVSNFLLWEVAYAEMWATPVLWPDFSVKDLDDALGSYAKRER